MNKWFLVLLFSCTSTKPVIILNRPTPSVKQNPYVVNWVTVSKETNVLMYKVQQSQNNKNWSTLTTVYPKHLPDSNKYSFQVPQPQSSRYYRIQATMTKSTYYTSVIYIQIK